MATSAAASEPTYELNPESASGYGFRIVQHDNPERYTIYAPRKLEGMVVDRAVVRHLFPGEDYVATGFLIGAAPDEEEAEIAVTIARADVEDAWVYIGYSCHERPCHASQMGFVIHSLRTFNRD